MRKKFLFAICFVLVLGYCVENATAIGYLDTDKYNLSFELLADGNQAEVHTDISELAVWSYFGDGFQGIDPWCAGGCTTETHCHCIEPTDGCMFMYLKTTEGGVYQVGDDVNDPNVVIGAGLRYTMTFDYRPEEPPGEFARSSLFYDDGGTDPYDDPTKQLVEGYFFAPRIDVPLSNCDCGIQGGLEVYDDACWEWTRDLTIKATIPVGHPAVGHTLGWKVIAAENYDPGNRYGFFDNVRISVEWATTAYNPSPEDGAEDVAQDVTLSWYPGIWAQAVDGHEVYFGTSFSDVNDANRSDVSGIYRGEQNRDVNSYLPSESPLELGETYYWRVDEVNEDFVGPPEAAPDAEGRWKGEVWSFEVTGFATNPSPEDGAEDQSIYTVLSWTPGTSSESHDVYLGTDFDEVNEADNSDPNVFKNNQVYSANSYDPGMLDLGRTYYWRIDERNDLEGRLIKGHIWRFTVAEYFVIDDMESYGSGTNAIDDTWEDRFSGNGSTGEIWLEIDDANYIQDEQSMGYSFENSDSPYYAETSREFSPAQDWTSAGFKVLAVSFRADMTNEASAVQPMYVFVSDGAHTGTVEYDDPNDLIRGRAGWEEWNIELPVFVEDEPLLDLSSIAGMGIVIGDGNEAGDGVVYIDDIRLYPTRCVVEEAAGSFTDDCEVDIYDLAALASDWLISGIGNVTASVPSDVGLFGHWTMDDNEDSGSENATLVEDVSVNDNDGILHDPDGDPGENTSAHHDADSVEGTGALEFDGVDDYVEIPALDVSSNTITLAAWVKRTVEGHIYDGIVMSSTEYDPCDEIPGPNYTAGLQFGSDRSDWTPNYELSFMWTGTSWEWHTGLFVPPEEWTFTALTVAPDVATIYLYDGIFLQAARKYDVYEPLSWHVPFHIADQMQFGPPPESDRFFPGSIDDVSIYNRTLAPEEILYLALQGPGSWYLPLEPWRANADGDDDVDLADYAIMADSWLTEVLWP
jgi:hypothetical protein